MTAIKEHLRKKVIEITKARISPSSLGFSYCWANRDKVLSLRLPLGPSRNLIPHEIIPKLVEMESDNVLKRVTYCKETDALVFALDEDRFTSSVLFSPASAIADSRSKKENLVVEYSSPNVAKPFHVGHLRSTIVGHFIANLLSINNNVKRINYLGDWGTQFGFIYKGLEQIGPTTEEFQLDPMGVLYRAYVESNNTPNTIEEARNMFLELENEDSKRMAEWEKIKSITYEHLKKTYNILGIRFDEYCCESDYRASKIHHVINDLVDKKIAYQHDGQLVADLSGKKIPLLRQNRSTLYITRDIAAALDRINKYDCNRIIYVVDKSQVEHFKTLSGIMESLGHNGVVEYLPFGRITGMSTRKGTSIFLADILEESMLKMAEQQNISKNTRTTDEETTRILGLTAVQVYILKHARLRNFAFDWTRALEGSGDSGVKIQYTHSRLHSLEERLNFELPSKEEFDTRSLEDPSVLPLVFEIARSDEIVSEAVGTLESSTVVAHLFKLCNLTSRALKTVKVKDQKENVARDRLLLFHTARLRIKRYMDILGLKTLNKM